MVNPFQYGGVVGEDAFCNREKELKDILRAMENGERLFIISERRIGKTSLIRLALQKLPQDNYLSVYIDLWPTDGVRSFALATAKAITENIATSADKMLQIARSFFERLAPSITMYEEGYPKVAFDFNRSQISTPELSEVLSAPAKIAKKRKCRVVIVFDEFQRIMEYGDDLVERTLRSVIQNHQDVSYIFLGSRKHLIKKMVLDQSRPLYRAGGHYPLEPIEFIHWLPFINKRFNDSNKGISEEIIRSICEITGGHPFYTQHLCHALWEICETGRNLTEDIVTSAVKLLLDRESYAYTSLWESLTLNQQRFLTGLAREREAIKVYKADFIQRYNLLSPSNVQRVIETLLERDIIDRDDGNFVISDRFFGLWIGKLF